MAAIKGENKEDDKESTDSGSTVNTAIILNERNENSRNSKCRMFILITVNIIFSLAQIPVILECQFNDLECRIKKPS